MKPTRKISSLPKWAQEHIRRLEDRAKAAELTLPWTKPGMNWCTIFHPDHRAQDGPENILLFTLHENHAHLVCSVGRKDCLFIGRGKESPE